jgi:hypothetical protein
MANQKLSIGCMLIMGGALTNCGGAVGSGDERRQHGNDAGWERGGFRR